MNMVMGYFSYVGMFQGLLKHTKASLEMSSMLLFSGKGTLPFSSFYQDCHIIQLLLHVHMHSRVKQCLHVCVSVSLSVCQEINILK